MKNIGTILFLLISFTITFAQKQILPDKTYHIDSINRYYMQAEMPVYISISHELNGKKENLSSSNNSDTKNEYKPIILDGHGKHNLRHMDGTKNEILDDFVIYADGRAPKTKLILNEAPKFSGSEGLFFGKNLRLSLNARDEMSGINAIYHSLNNAAFEKYDNFKNLDAEGEYSLQYYATDNVGNTEAIKNFQFTVDLSAPKTYYHIVGIAKDKIISKSSRLYLTASDSVSGLSATYYHFDDLPEKKYLGGDIVFAFLADGNHTMHYRSVDNVQNQEVSGSFSFYLDKIAPIMSADVLGDKFVVEDKVYYSGRTKLKLTAVDNKSGIKNIMYSIDNSDFSPYEDPFYLPGKAGEHTIKYYAIDNADNQGSSEKKFSEYKHVVGVVFVDLTGPSLKNKFKGPNFRKGDTIYISNQTKINLSATDSESGLKKINYILDDAIEKDYAPPLYVTEEGYHKISIVGYDNVNNRNIDAFEFVVDTTPADIIVNYSAAPITEAGDTLILPSYVSVYLACSDLCTECIKISYSINKQPFVIYKDKLSGFQKNKLYEIKIQAEDGLKNKIEKIIWFKTNDF